MLFRYGHSPFFYTSFYSWEREVFGEDPSKHFQTYSGAIVHVKKLGHENLSFHTYVRFSKDLASNEFSLRNKLYNAYFEWENLFNNKVDISFGRQFVWAGVGNGTIDGGKIEISLRKWGTVGTYIGTLTPLRESWKVDSWAESHMIGAYYKNRLLGTDYQLSWVRKNRKPVSYKAPGQFTEKTITLSSLQGQLAGLDVSRSFTDKLTLFIRAEGTILNQEEKKLDIDRFTFDRFEASVDFKPIKKFMFTGQYYFRKPRQNLNSIFSIFSNSDSRELWFNVFVYPVSSLLVFGGWAAVDYDYNDTNRYNAGFAWKYITVSANKFTGYSGDMDNITGSLQVPVRSNLWVRGSLSSGRYKLYEDASDYNNMVTSSIGATFTPRKAFTIDVEGQGIRNELTSSDFRLFGRINYWFFAKR